MSNKERIYHFIEDEKYINYFCNKYLLLSKREKKEVSDLEVKMNKYISMTAPYTPDYYGFVNFIFPPFEADFEQFKINIDRYKHPIMLPEIECSIDLLETREKYSYFFVILICLSKLIKKPESFIILQKIKLIIMLCLEEEKCKKLLSWYMAKVDAELSGNVPNNIKDLTSLELKAHFFTALKKHQFNKAARVLGAYQIISDESSEKFFILDGFDKFMNGNYLEAKKDLDKIKFENTEYNSSIWLKLEILAIEGEIETFLKVINESNAGYFDYWQLMYWQMELLLNNKDENLSLENFFQEISAFTETFDKPHGSNYYSYKVINLLLSVCNELIEIYEDIDTYKNVTEEIIENDELNKRVYILKIILIIYSKDIEIWFGNNENLLPLIKGREKLISLCVNLFNDTSVYLISEDLELFYLKEYILFLFRNKENNLAFSLISKHLEKIEDAFSKNNQNSIEIISSYCMQKLLDNTNDAICNKYKKIIENDSFVTELKSKQVYKFLSENAKIAFISAEWQFNKSQEENYGWKDAGLISLAYFRVIEVELNTRIVIPLFDSIGIEQIENLYYEYKSYLNSSREVEKYTNKWNSIIRSYKDRHSLELGSLERLFGYISYRSKRKDTLSNKLQELFLTLLTDEGKKAFQERFFEDIVNKEIREKFRNPPSHTRYLSYTTACECKEFVMDTLNKLSVFLVSSIYTF